MLGMGGLVLVDISKYYYLDSSRVGWIGDDVYQKVAIVIIFSCITVGFSYFFSKRLITKKRQCFFYKKKRTSFIKYIKFIVFPLSIIFLLLNDRSGYASMVGSCIKGLLVALFIYGIFEKDRMAVIVSIISLFTAVDDSSRRAYIAIFMPIIFIYPYVIKNKYGNVNLKVKLILVVFLFFIFIFLNAIRSSNDFGVGFDPDRKVSNTLYYMKNLTSVDTFYNTAFLIERFPKPWDFFYGETYLSVLVAPIPRSLWNDKPVGLGAPLGLMNRYSYRGKFDNYFWEQANQFTLSPGFVGEAYANFGYAGVFLISLLLGIVAAFFDNKIIFQGITAATIPWIMFLSTFILVHRGDFYVSVNYQIFMFLTASIFFKFSYSRYSWRFLK